MTAVSTDESGLAPGVYAIYGAGRAEQAAALRPDLTVPIPFKENLDEAAELLAGLPAGGAVVCEVDTTAPRAGWDRMEAAAAAAGRRRAVIFTAEHVGRLPPALRLCPDLTVPMPLQVPALCGVGSEAWFDDD